MASDFTLFHHRWRKLFLHYRSFVLTIRKRRGAFVSLFKLELTARGFIERAYALVYGIKYMRLTFRSYFAVPYDSFGIVLF